MIRALRPTDVLAYLSFCNRLRHGHGDAGGSGQGGNFDALPVVVGFLGRSLALEPGRESWVQIDHASISGLVAAKRRVGADIWDVDQLSIIPSADSLTTATRLLEQLLSAAVDDGIHKVFLRLDRDDPAQQWVRHVGFSQYCREITYARPEVPSFARPPQDPSLRQRKPADHHSVFQLYCSAVPFRVRQAEGMTLHEWRWTDGWAVRPVGFSSIVRSPRTDYVVDGTPRVAAWLQVDRASRRLVVLNDDEVALNALSDLLTFGLTKLGPGGPAACAARDYQPRLARALDEGGFHIIREEALFARGLAARIPELKLAPVRATLQ